MKEQIIKLLLESIDLQKLTSGIIDNIIEEALDKVVEDSSNPYDNSIKAILWPILEVETKKALAKLIDKIKEENSKEIVNG